MYTGVLDILSRTGLEGIGLFYSIYPGKVVNHEDVSKNNSIMVEVKWPGLIFKDKNIVVSAIPFNQGGLDGDGIKYLAPEVGDNVYLMFLNGDPNQAMYIRQVWPSEGCPTELMGPNKAGFITPKGNSILVDDEEGTLEIDFKGDIIIKSSSSITLESPNITVGGEVVKLGTSESNQPGILINELTERLNQAVKEIELLKSQINLHTHSTTTGPTTPPTLPLTQVITPFTNEDYSNPNQLS